MGRVAGGGRRWPAEAGGGRRRPSGAWRRAESQTRLVTAATIIHAPGID